MIQLIVSIITREVGNTNVPSVLHALRVNSSMLHAQNQGIFHTRNSLGYLALKKTKHDTHVKLAHFAKYSMVGAAGGA